MRNNKFLLLVLIMILLVSVTGCYGTVDEVKWEKAVSKETLSNFMVETIETSEIDNDIYKTTLKVDNGILYILEEVHSGDEIYILDECYYYETETGEKIMLSYNEDKQLWEKHDDDDLYDDLYEFINFITEFNYSEFTYNEQGSYYSMVDNIEEHRLYFSGQKIAKYETISVNDPNYKYTYEFSSYGEVELILPNESEIYPN